MRVCVHISLCSARLCLFNPRVHACFSVQELSVSERQRRQAQQERDDLADEMVNSSSGKFVLYHKCSSFSVMFLGELHLFLILFSSQECFV